MVPQSNATVRVVKSLAASDDAFKQQMNWVGDYDLVFLAKVGGKKRPTRTRRRPRRKNWRHNWGFIVAVLPGALC